MKLCKWIIQDIITYSEVIVNSASHSQDNRILKEKLPNVTRFYEVPYKRFNHGDFLWAKDSYKLVYKDVIEQIDKHSQGHTSSFKQESVPTWGPNIELDPEWEC